MIKVEIQGIFGSNKMIKRLRKGWKKKRDTQKESSIKKIEREITARNAGMGGLQLIKVQTNTREYAINRQTD